MRPLDDRDDGVRRRFHHRALPRGIHSDEASFVGLPHNRRGAGRVIFRGREVEHRVNRMLAGLGRSLAQGQAFN
jgi:hypothetical protein